MPKVYGRIDREPFICIDCNRLVTVDEQYKVKYHQTKRCKSCYGIWKKEYQRLAVRKHREEKGSQ